MEPDQTGRPSVHLSVLTRVALGVLALLLVFGAVLALELGSGSRVPQEGQELFSAPQPILPASNVRGYAIRPEPELALALEDEYRRRSVTVTGVEAASVPLRDQAASVLAASLNSAARPSSSEFRTGVLTGAAGGFGIDPGKSPFRFVNRSDVDIYMIEGEPGRLFVWFFRDAFVQLFVPTALAGEADQIQQAILFDQLARRPTQTTGSSSPAPQ